MPVPPPPRPRVRPPMRWRMHLLAALGLSVAPAVTHAQAWCDRAPRAGTESLERVRVRDPWFHVYRMADGVFALYEPSNFQEVISWLIVGRTRALLFDTGMGMSRISDVVRELTRLPVTVVNSHSHYDHVGGNAEFRDVRLRTTDFTLDNADGIPHADVAIEVRPDAFCARSLRTAFDTAAYAIRPFTTTATVRDGETFDLGGRTLEVLTIPGHTPDAVALLDRARGFLWTGDTFYPGPIWLYFPGTDLAAYEGSMTRLAGLAPSLTRLFPAHNLPQASPSVLPKVLDAFRQVRAGVARHDPRGEGLVEYPFDGFSFLMRAPGPPLRVLFIGNSYTYFNNLPAIVADLARTAAYERPITVELVAAPGASLRDHWMSGAALSAIRRGPWDFVVLQEQSMLGVLLLEGSPSVNDPAGYHMYARLFAREVKTAGATPVFFLTWARRATPALQDRLTSAVVAIARETGGRVAPVGIAWQAARTARPALGLYAPDGTHPSPAGSYLAAATLWATISGTPARGLLPSAAGPRLTDSMRVRFSADAGPLVALADSDAVFLQRQADAAVDGVPRLVAPVVSTERLPPLPSADPVAPASLEGRWTGTMKLFDAPVAVELRVTRAASPAEAAWRVCGTAWSAESPVRDVTFEGGRLSFVVPDPRFLAPDERHHAVIRGDTLYGRAEIGSAEQPPRLLGSWRLTRASGPGSCAP